MWTRPWRPLAPTLCFLALTLGSGLLAPRPATAAHPFYENLLLRGISAYQNAEHASAARQLRIAVFGLLEEPDTLARGLSYLALAQLAIDDSAGFTTSAERLLELERRFGALGRAPIEPALRQTLLGEIASRVSYQQLSDLPLLADAAHAQRGARLAELDPEPRRRELESLLAANPGQEPWALMLAELELGRGRAEAGRAALEPLLERQPEHPAARCLRGWADAELGHCASALADFAFCDPQTTVDESGLAARLRCQVAAGDWDGAAALIAELPGALRQRKPFRRLVRDAERGRRQAARSETQAPADEPPAVVITTADGATEDLATEDVATEDSATEDLATEQASMLESNGDQPPATGEGAVAAVDEEPSGAAVPADDRPPAATGESTIADQDGGIHAQLIRAFELARDFADRHPERRESQIKVAELAYRLSRWPQVIAYLERGPIPDQRPDLLFYLAVAYHETGQHEAAAEALRRCLPRLQRTAFVDDYADRILGDGR